MMTSRLPKKPPKFVNVKCLTCHALLTQALKEEARFVKCPDCYVPVRVPSQAQVMALMPPPKPEKRIGTYGVAESGADNSEQIRRDITATIVHCPVCRARLHPKLKSQARNIRCPDCDSAVPVPSANEVKQQRLEEKRQAKRREAKRKPGRLTLATSTIDWDEVYTPKTDLDKELAAIKSVEIPDPPKWTFFSGVFNILWRKEIVFRWVRLTIFCAITFFFLMMTSRFLLVGGYIGAAAAFFGLPLIWFSLWTVSYASIIFDTILIETANGNDRILEWPEPDWKEYALRFYQYFFVCFTSGTLSWLVTNIVLLFWHDLDFWEIFPVSMMLLTIPMILSVEESGSPWFVCTRPVLKTFITCWWGWAILYCSLVLMWLVSVGVLITATIYSAGFFYFLIPTITIPICTIYSGRIMGRFLWRSIVVPSQYSDIGEKVVFRESVHPEENAKPKT